MSVQLTAAERLALFSVWQEKCAWCHRPLYFSEFEVEHIIPKSLINDASKRESALALHGLPSDYDLFGLGNLVPSCGPCNRGKGPKVPPEAPAITRLLREAQCKAPVIQKQAEAFAGRNELDKAIAIIEEAANSLGVVEISRLENAARQIVRITREATGVVITNVHPALKGLRDRERWTYVQPLSDTVAFVADGRTGGAIGTHWSWECDRCGSNGPWNGNVCMTCGNHSVPDW